MNILEKIKSIFHKEDEKTNDKLGVYPEKVHVPAFLERRYLKTSRALAVITIISMSLNIMLGSIIFTLPSQVKSHPKAYSYNDRFGGFKELEKIYVRESASDIIFEEQIREYIYLRNMVMPDIDIMKYTWQPGSRFYWLSGKSVYNSFQVTDYARIMNLITTKGYRQDVYFRWSRKIKPGRWVAEFDTYEYVGWQNKKSIRKRWRAYITVVVNKEIPYGNLDNKLKNPLNVNIVGYYLSSMALNDND